MRRNVWMVLSLALITGANGPLARAQQAAGAPRAKAAPAPAADGDALKELPPLPTTDRLLELWEKQSRLLKTLDVKFHRVDKSPAWDEDEHFEGRAILKSPNLARLNFDKVGVDPKKQQKPEPYELIICTGKEVWQYRTDLKQIFIYPLAKQDQQHALEEGPLPFLFNM